MYNFQLIQDLYKNYAAATIDKRISPKDAMNNQWYFDVGRSAVEVIAIACMASNIQTVNKILDLPCGYGRVLRHLVHLFPQAQCDACDLDEEAVDFCVSTFGVRPIYSREELTEVDFSSIYDIIWAGSLFTHLSQDIARKWMAHLARFLSPHGIVVATLHGRWSQNVHNVAPFIGEDRWNEILKDYNSLGYGYRDYLMEDSHQYISGSYGISLVKPHVTIRNLEDMKGIRIYLYSERGWSDVQDVVVYGRPAYDEPWPTM